MNRHIDPSLSKEAQAALKEVYDIAASLEAIFEAIYEVEALGKVTTTPEAGSRDEVGIPRPVEAEVERKSTYWQGLKRSRRGLAEVRASLAGVHGHLDRLTHLHFKG